jgi:hypothetical protein
LRGQSFFEERGRPEGEGTIFSKNVPFPSGAMQKERTEVPRSKANACIFEIKVTRKTNAVQASVKTEDVN